MNVAIEPKAKLYMVSGKKAFIQKGKTENLKEFYKKQENNENLI